MICRFDKKPIETEFLDLFNSPPSNSFLAEEDLDKPEVFYPLKLYVSERTFLVQLEEYKKAGEIFDHDYVYFSSYSSSWLDHAKTYVEKIVDTLNLTQDSFVVEIASNDGYLLRNFVSKQIPCLGIEPTANTAAAAEKLGIRTITKFFGKNLANELAEDKKADLIIGNNVFAHVPDINDFVSGLKTLLSEKGTINLEFPHLLCLMREGQFDTVYHEHFWYFSLYALLPVFEAHDLFVYDVEQLKTHGGSLRLYIAHNGDTSKKTLPSVGNTLDEEIKFGLNKLSTYREFPKKVLNIKLQLLEFLVDCKKHNKTVYGYGAAAKGNTLLNYCGVKQDLLPKVIDASPHKIGKFLPGSHIPVVAESEIKKDQPDYILILPWNLQTEITDQLSYIKSWGGQFIIPIPELTVVK
ncbi:class I SAM-dependent methyltransferase [Marinoscillum furvescens]|uniref:Methyltransferase family protein n=1 Tax=Marinoscillum furvescens DSM 4134 TaxID=1122208 RepID=A0A3D9L2K9_MARFU|nr:class I SAM-dependent methyltransferase [Marinoscillum furvescens]RED96624.1 methyltransferase family protein [Marinoscillum furvescens DSM 4134]